MSKITLSFMQRFMTKLDTAIRGYVNTQLSPLSIKTYLAADGIISGYTASNDITVERMCVTLFGSVVTVMIGFHFNNDTSLVAEKILISGFDTPKGEVSAVAQGQYMNSSVYLNLSGNLVSRIADYSTDTLWVGFTYIKE